jgi:hypothetical protein
MVGYGDAVRIAAEVVNYVFRPSGGSTSTGSETP